MFICMYCKLFRELLQLVGKSLDSRLKGCELEFRQERWEKFFLWVSVVCWHLFGACSTPPPLPVFLQWHIKDSDHSAISAGGRLHLNTHTPLTQWSRSGLTMLLSRHSVGTIWKQAHMQLVREHLVTVISAHWAIVDWSWHKGWN